MPTITKQAFIKILVLAFELRHDAEILDCRHLQQLLPEEYLTELSAGLYYRPRESGFGNAPVDENALVEACLKRRRYLLTSLYAYDRLGVGTTRPRS